MNSIAAHRRIELLDEARGRLPVVSKCRGFAFTLIELLVVISIIVLLMALLIPALTQAKNNAKTTMCQSQVRQITLSMANYAMDEDGAYPMIQSANAQGCWQNWCSYGTVSPFDSGVPVAYALLWKYKYLDNILAVRCPGRDYEDWPAQDIDHFLNPPPWPF